MNIIGVAIFSILEVPNQSNISTTYMIFACQLNEYSRGSFVLHSGYIRQKQDNLQEEENISNQKYRIDS